MMRGEIVKNTRMLTEGALMLAIFTVMLFLSLFVPLAGVIIQFFMILPFLLYSAKYPVKNSVLLVVAAMLVTVFTGNVMSAMLALLYGSTGTVMGYSIRTEKSKVIAYAASSMVFLANLVLFYAVAAKLFELNLMNEIVKMFMKSADQYVTFMETLGQKPDPKMIEQFQEMGNLIKTLAPSILVFGAFVFVLLFILINFPIIKRLGVNVPAFAPFRELKFPRSILFYYLIVLVVTVFMKPEEGTFIHMAVLNAAYILQILLLIQGLSFLYFLSHWKKWPVAVPVIATVMIFVMPLFFSIVRLLGIIDIGFDLRQRLSQKP